MFGLFARKGPFKSQVMTSGENFEVAPNQSLLNAALAAGIAWPHSCRVGSCGTCRCRLVKGKIKPLNDFSYVLTEDELDSGLILACQTALRSDIEVEVALDHEAKPHSVPKTVEGTVDSSRSLTHDILEIRIRLDELLPRYIAGQYAEVSIPGIDKPRNYSFASAPAREFEGYVTFHVRHVPGGKMTTWFHDEHRVGERVSVGGPFGFFGLRESLAPVVCVAGGSGMAPIKSLLEQVAESGFERRFVYLFGARTQKDLYCLDEMQDITARGNGHFQFIPILSNEPDESDWGGARGFVTELIRRGDLVSAQSEAYLCGPPPMIDVAISELKSVGVAESNIHFDKFLDASHLPGHHR